MRQSHENLTALVISIPAAVIVYVWLATHSTSQADLEHKIVDFGSAILVFGGAFAMILWIWARYGEDKKEARKMLKEALALALETENFSEAHCEATAAAKREEFLNRAAEIRAAEAERQLNEKKLTEKYEWIANTVATDSHLEPKSVVESLRNADIWNYRVLQAAIKQKERNTWTRSG